MLTSDVSHPVRFHASKETARGLLSNARKWPGDRFDKVDWEHLDLAMKSKNDMYKIWRFKHDTGFCGTLVQVGKYSGLECPDKKCLNCGRRETATHILLCPNKDRTCLLTNTTNDLSKWLSQDGLTDLELAY